MHSRFRVIETIKMEDGRPQYRVVDLVEGDLQANMESSRSGLKQSTYVND